MAEAKNWWPRISGTLLLASFSSIALYIFGAYRNQNDAYSYMIWNLFLAWLPLVFIAWLLLVLRRKRWSSWEGITASLLWLFFLPNSFYIISDFIHLQDAPRVDVLYDAVMLMSFASTGLLLGYTSLVLFHLELRKRLAKGSVRRVIGTVLLLCSFAIYMGRELRWNSWDMLFNPAGILFDVSNRVLHPLAYPGMFVTVTSFFVLLTTFYIIAWNLARAVRSIR